MSTIAPRSPRLAIAGPDRQGITARNGRRCAYLPQGPRQEISTSLDRLDQLGAVFCELELRVDVGAKSTEFVLQPVKHPLDLELFGEPVARERLGVMLQRGADHGAEATAGQLFPEVPSMLAAGQIQRDLPVIEPMIVGQTTQEQRMNELVDQVWESLRLHDPHATTENSLFIGAGRPAEVLAVCTNEGDSPHFLNYEGNHASQIGGRLTLDRCPSAASVSHELGGWGYFAALRRKQR
jgi:hypothetical protein